MVIWHLSLFIQSQWTLKLFADGEFVLALDGIPELSPKTQMVFTVSNKDNAVADLPDPLHPVTATAYFRDLR